MNSSSLLGLHALCLAADADAALDLAAYHAVRDEPEAVRDAADTAHAAWLRGSAEAEAEEARASYVAVKEQWEASRDASAEARATLALALGAAPWGAQPDGAFVTRSAWHTGDSSYAYLHAPNRRGILASAKCGRRDDWWSLTGLHTHAAAWQSRLEERDRNRAATRTYASARAEVLRALESGREVVFSDGQEGGTLRLTESSPAVGAPGVFRELGVEAPLGAYVKRRVWLIHPDQTRLAWRRA